MISLEGLTLATGRQRRGRLHPAHLRPLRPRRPDPQHVPRGRAARASTTPPTRRCGSSTRSTATSRATRRPSDAARCCCRSCATSSSTTCRARASASASIRADGLLRQGAEGYQLTWMDAKVGRLGGDAAARQGGRDQRALVQRAAAAGGLARRGAAATARRAAICASTPSGAQRVVQRALLVRGRRAICYDVVDGEQRRRPGLPAEPAVRHLARPPVLDRARWEPVLDVVRERAAHAGRAALARARAPRLQADTTTATCARATPRTTRAPSGAG